MKYECRDGVDRDVSIDKYLALRFKMQWLKQLADLAMDQFRKSEAEYSRISFNLGAMGALQPTPLAPQRDQLKVSSTSSNDTLVATGSLLSKVVVTGG